MPVVLRKKKNKSKKNGPDTSLYLDVHSEGRRYKKFLDYKVYSKPRDFHDRMHNRDVMALAEGQRIEYERELYRGDIKEGDTNADFLKLFQTYVDTLDQANKRIYRASLEKFKDFLKKRGMETVKGKNVTVVFCEDFGEYLKKNLNFETPLDYFRKFKRVLRRAKKQGVVNIEVDEVKVKFNFDKGAIRKDTLTMAEIELLYSKPMPHPEVCKAFTFSLNTGIDFATVSKLTAANLVDGYVVFTRGKTQKQNRIKLNTKALECISPGKGLLYNLPSHPTCLKWVQRWVDSAEIKKHITWHCARHTVGDILINDKNVNLRAVQDILGHSSPSITMKYTRLRQKTKDDAIDLL